MQHPLQALTLLLALAGAGLGGYALARAPGVPADLDRRLERLDALEARLADLEAVATHPGAAVEREAPLLGRANPVAAAAPALPAGASAAAGSSGTEGATAGTGPLAAEATPERQEEIEALVEQAVEKRARQYEVMAQKKPTIDVFAETLELSEEQRRVVEDQVVQSQREIKSILEIPTADGTLFLDELVDVMAEGFVHPGQAQQRGGELFARILREKIPGTNETYAARIDVVKRGLRDTFKRDWTPKQYATFGRWKMDPTEVRGIPSSPWKELESRIRERAKDLGVDLPEGR